MNLALHGFLLQVFLSILNFQHGSLVCSAGEPGYLDFDNLPETNFSCQGKVIGGYYADVEAGCQMFHVCTIGQKDEIMDIKFLCLNGTVFDQETRVCERVDEVDCSKSERFYNLNLELYGNNAVTLSLHENSEDEDIPSDTVNDHQQRTTSARPTTTTSTTTTTSKPSKPSTTPASSSFSHPAGYPQHFQPQPPFPQVHTSQSKSLYDDKNGGYHHQYIFHNGERSNNQQATSYQLFSNQGVSSTTIQPPQVHQIRFSSTSSPQIIHNEPSTVAPLYHATSSTIQTLLNSNGNSPALINPIFHNHGIASTTEQFSLHNNNPRETSEYRENGEQNIRPLEAVQSTNKGKVSKLILSPIPTPSEASRSVQPKTNQNVQQQRLTESFLPTQATIETTIRSFYPTPKPSSKPVQSIQLSNEQVPHHIHVLPPVPIPQLKPHQITINLPAADIQRIVQSPSSLLPSQSRVIVTAKASVSDESGRPLNTTQLVTLPLPTIPASYDDYKEGDESFDPFYRDVPKIRNARRVGLKSFRRKRAVGQTKSSMVSFVYGGDSTKKEGVDTNRKTKSKEKVSSNGGDFLSIKESLRMFRDILFGETFAEDPIRSVFGGGAQQNLNSNKKAKGKSRESLEDLETKASKNFKVSEYEDEENVRNERDKVDNEESREQEKSYASLNTKESDTEEYIYDSKYSGDEKHSKGSIKDPEASSEVKEKVEETPSNLQENEDIVLATTDEEIATKKPTSMERTLEVVVLDANEQTKQKSLGQVADNVTEKTLSTTEVPTISTDEEAIKSKATNDDKDSENVQEQDKNSRESKKAEANEEEATEKSKERVEAKVMPRRKSSRIRSSKGKVSARKKEMKVDEVEMQKNDTVTTTSSSIANSNNDQIDKHIFDEAESQTSKEVDIRAVGNRNSYGKSLHSGKDHDTGKDTKKIEANEYEVLEKHSKNAESDRENTAKFVQESTVPTLYDDEDSKDEKTDEESERKEQDLSVNKESLTDHDNVENKSTISSEEELKDETKEDSKSSQEIGKSSRQEKSMKIEDSLSREVFSHRQDESEKLADEEEETESQEYSTIKSEEINSQETYSEYQDSTEVFYENTREDNRDDEYRDSNSSDDLTESSEHEHSEEITGSSRENNEERDEEESTMNDHEDSTEGVLKFTDELPKDKKQDVSDNRKSSESIENTDHDYVDDNYEPDNYKEQDSTESNNLNDEKSDKTDKTEDDDHVENTTVSKNNENDEKEDSSEESTTETIDLQQRMTTTTTTTSRSTLPKLFKPISARKNYVYIPPTTTPNPVVIKPRLSLLNPKPAKPPRSYNELAPKPVIRKFPLLVRKATTTTASTTIKDEDESETAEMPTTTEPVATTETTRSEENVLESKLARDQEKDTSELPKEELLNEKPPKEELLNEKPPKEEVLSKNKDDQVPSPSEQKTPTNLKKEDQEDSRNSEGFTPYPITRLTTLASAVEKTLKYVESTSMESETTTLKSFAFIDVEILSTTVPPVATTPYQDESSTVKPPMEDETSTTSSSKSPYVDVTETPPIPETSTTTISSTSTSSTTTVSSTTLDSASINLDEVESTTTRSLNRKSMGSRRQDSFNCLEKEMYRFYGDNRDCRLFHYCSPGFTSRQVLDFRFVCEEGTSFDEESQSCRHDVRGKICPDRQW